MSMHKIVFTVIGIGGLVAAGLTSVANAATPIAHASSSASVATMGSVSVSVTEVDAVLASMPQHVRSTLKDDHSSLEQWLRSQLTEKVLLAEAETKGWAKRSDVAKAIALATKEIVLRNYLDSLSRPPEGFLTEADVDTAYEQNKERLLIPAQYSVQQIYLDAPSSDTAAVTVAKKQAIGLIKQAKAKGADFSELARMHSKNIGSSESANKIGMQPLSQFVPEVRSVIANMKPGEISNPVQTSTGLHIIKMEGVQPAHKASRKEADTQLRQALYQQYQTQAAQAYIANLHASLPLNIDSGQLTKLLQ